MACLWGCSEERLNGGTTVEEGEPATADGKFNAFLKKEMTGVYLWADKVREKAESLRVDTSSQWYFSRLKYENDPWSRLSGEAFEGELAAMDDGYDVGFGWTVTIWQLTAFTFEAKMNHVYPGSPAADAGIERGDFITRLDGENLSEANYMKLFNTRTPLVARVRKRDGRVIDAITLSPREYDVIPIAKDTVLLHEGKRVGYMYYTSFVYKNEGSLQELTDAFTRFKQAGVDEFILDLRYNGGGYALAAVHLATLLAPVESVKGREVLINKIWNGEYQKQFEGNEAYTVERFDDRVPETARLGLSRLWVLTSKNTASASEMVISGLKPYMEVRTVGDRTTGKNAGGSMFSRTGDEERSAYLITMLYTNKDGESVEGGIPADFSDYSANLFYKDTTALGDPRDTFVAIALQEIGGAASRSVDRPDTAAWPRAIEPGGRGRLILP
jgi:C-terminal processing protease CtpA/Prc